MHHETTSPAHTASTRWHGPVAALLASACTLLLLGAVVQPFHSASQLAWLAPTPANTAAVDACHALTRADAQRRCLEQAVAVALARQASSLRVAHLPETGAQAPQVR